MGKREAAKRPVLGRVGCCDLQRMLKHRANVSLVHFRDNFSIHAESDQASCLNFLATSTVCRVLFWTRARCFFEFSIGTHGVFQSKACSAGGLAKGRNMPYRLDRIKPEFEFLTFLVFSF
jgi:hypothetical protein